MSGHVMRQMLCLTLLLLISATGCSSMRTVESTGTAQWSGMGVSLILPAGFWEVEEVDPGQVVEFRKTASSAHIVLMRVPAREDKQDGLALRRLFVHFEDKQELARWSRPLRSGVGPLGAGLDQPLGKFGHRVSLGVC